jgi:hypothetical protein
MVFWRFIFEITHHSLKTRQGHNHRTHNEHSGDLGFDAKSGQLEINPQCPQISTTPASNIINTATAATSPLSKLPRHHPENAIARPAQQMLKRPLNESSKQRVTYLPARLQVQLKRIGSVAAHHSEI